MFSSPISQYSGEQFSRISQGSECYVTSLTYGVDLQLLTAILGVQIAASRDLRYQPQ